MNPPVPRGMAADFQPEGKGRGLGLPLVVGLHLVLGYLLVSGLGSSALQTLKKPLEAVLIQEVTLPPPPPPPPAPPRVVRQAAPQPRTEAPPPPFVPPAEVAPPPSAAPVIVASPTPPPQPVEIARPAPAPALPVAAAPAPAAPQEIGVACPTQVKPEISARAMDEAIPGVVRAQATIRNQAVSEVKILSGPRIYHAAVRSAMLLYRCTAPDGTVAVQEFHFKFE